MTSLSQSEASIIYLVQVDKLVIIRLHHKLCLLTELRHPEIPHDGLKY